MQNCTEGNEGNEEPGRKIVISDPHCVRCQDFTRERQLTFPLLLLFNLQQTFKSIQRHLSEFHKELSIRGTEHRSGVLFWGVGGEFWSSH